MSRAIGVLAGAAGLWVLLLQPLVGVSQSFLLLVGGVALVQGGGISYLQRRHGGAITVPTVVTLLRAGAVAALAGFLLTRPTGVASWLPAGVFAAAATLDAADGRLARHLDATSPLGDRLDSEVDAAAILLGAGVAISHGMAPIVYFGVGLAHYAFRGGLLVREWHDAPVWPLPDSQLRAINGGLQQVVIVALLAPVPGASVSRWLAMAAMGPFLLVFLWDWLAVTGRR